MFANVPINRVTGQQWEYERIPFETSSGQRVMLYSVLQKDYNGDGVINSEDIAWIGDNTTSRVQNIGAFDGDQAAAQLPGAAVRVAEAIFRPLAGAGVVPLLEFHRHRPPLAAAGRQRRGADVLGRQLDEFAEPDDQQPPGPLPYTPRYEFKLSGSYTVPRVDIDLGGRLRTHSGRGLWQLETYPQHTQFGDPPGGVIDPGGLGQIVAIDPKHPAYLPTLTLFDLRVEKSFKVPANQTVRFIVDGFNIFNTFTPTDVDPTFEYRQGHGHPLVTPVPVRRALGVLGTS